MGLTLPANFVGRVLAKLSTKTREDILADYERGVSNLEISVKYGVSPSYPSILAARSGLKRKVDARTREKMASAAQGRTRTRKVRDMAEEAAPRPAAPVPVAEIHRLAAKGLGITAIGALLRCSYRDVAAVLG